MTERAAGDAEPEIVVLPDADAVSEEAAHRIADALTRAVAARGRADWLTTGGSAPAGIYRELASPPLRDRVPWDAVHLWWGDDRFVPREHSLSNVAPADRVLLSLGARGGQSGMGGDARDIAYGDTAGTRIRAENIHPIPATIAIGEGRGPDWAAEQYDAELRASGIPTDGGWPVFDTALMGVGPDGHILSVFPGSTVLDDDSTLVLPVPAPTHVEPHVPRVTLNPRVLDVARQVLVIMHGAGKAEIVGGLFGSDRDARRLPALLLRRPGVTWLFDRAAASKLPDALLTAGR